jgi:hypothetical protein
MDTAMDYFGSIKGEVIAKRNAKHPRLFQLMYL